VYEEAGCSIFTCLRTFCSCHICLPEQIIVRWWYIWVFRSLL